MIVQVAVVPSAAIAAPRTPFVAPETEGVFGFVIAPPNPPNWADVVATGYVVVSTTVWLTEPVAPAPVPPAIVAVSG